MSQLPSPSQPSPTDLRIFAGLQLPFWGLFTWLQHERWGSTISIALLVAAGSLTVMGLTQPMTIRPVYRGWMLVVQPVGWIVSQIVLAGLYFGLLLPIGVLLRLRHRDPLEQRWPAPSSTGWKERSAPPPLESYFRQY